MAWTSPMTATANSAFTAAQFNTHVRDNLLETAPALATDAGQIFVATGSNSIAARSVGRDVVSTEQSTSSTGFTNLATPGPTVTVSTGTSAIAFVGARAWNSAATGIATMGVTVSGASSINASDDDAFMVRSNAANQFMRAHAAILYQGTLTAGSNTFTAQYHVDSGTGSWRNRSLIVIPL